MPFFLLPERAKLSKIGNIGLRFGQRWLIFSFQVHSQLKKYDQT